ncbi:MAG: gliding motility-associated C-terminal domain-containing protein [Bacteroidia bacterium]|nr:gliding motility-associated C-terminal domain-containing protein [Bacteroidia bacterium]
MKTKIIYLFISLIFVCTGITRAQQSDYNWYFGNMAGINFKNNGIALTDGKLVTSEGCASVSNAKGDLLFYTDGIVIYNRYHRAMTNGDGLKGHQSSSQSALIVPMPGNSLVYYLFTSDANFGSNGINYSLVEFTNQTDSGRVIRKNENLFAPASEKLTAVKHANGIDFWIITHEAGNATFRCYLLDTSGIHLASSVQSSVGSALTISWNNADAVGTLKASRDGKKLVSAVLGKATFELYDFNPATGVVSNAVALTDAVKFNNAYSAEFSPDGKYVYFSCTGAKGIYQTAVYPDAARMLQYLIYIPFNSGYGPGALQIGPDERLYIARASASFLSTIRYPNGVYPLSQFNDTGITLGGKQSLIGLPNNVHFSYETDFDYRVDCSSDTVFFTNKTVKFDSIRWNFGDPSTGKWNTDNKYITSHVFSAYSVYNVSLIVFLNGGTDTVSKNINIIKHKPVDLPADTVFCFDTTFFLSVFDFSYQAYLWQDNSSDFKMKVSSDNCYRVKVFDGVCAYEDSTRIAFKRSPVFSLGNDTVLCSSFTIPLVISGQKSLFNWQDGSKDSVFKVIIPGEYFVLATNECGTFSDTVLIEDCLCIPIVPTAFSPNGNGHNDTFRAEGCVPFAFEMFIFNRWGQLVFQSNSIVDGWNGMVNGKPAEEGVYGWLIRYTQTTRVKRPNRELHGSVTLLR